MVEDTKKDYKIQRVNLHFIFGIKGKVEIRIRFTGGHVVTRVIAGVQGLGNKHSQ